MPSFNDFPDKERLNLLKKQTEYAKENSPYYRKSLEGCSIETLNDLKKLPFTDADTIRKEERRLVCVPASGVFKIVSIRSSATSGAAKRIYLSRTDIDHTVSFFAEGMGLLCSKGNTAAILMENSSENSISELLARALENTGVHTHCPGAGGGSISELSEALIRISPNIIIGFPWTVRALSVVNPSLRPGCILLSADYIPEGLPSFIEGRWKCRVVSHFGMTETAYGCAVETPGSGCMLLRKDEFIAETINPDTGKSCSLGKAGELVLTTLQREAMPLIRYRTGDIAIIDEGENIIRVFGRKDIPKERYKLEDLLSSDYSIIDYELKEKKLTIRCINNPDALLISRLSDKYDITIQYTYKDSYIIPKGKHIR